MNNQLITVRFAIVMKNFMVTFQFETYVEVFFNAYVLNKTYTHDFSQENNKTIMFYFTRKLGSRPVTKKKCKNFESVGIIYF